MDIHSKYVGWASVLSGLVGLGQLVACTTEDTDPATPDTAATNTTSTGTTGGGGSSSTTATNTTASSTTATSTTASSTTSGGGTICANKITIPSTSPGITDFDDYDGSADLGAWSFPLGGDSASGVYAGTFRYGDDEGGFPEAFEMVAGDDSTYALSVSDTLAEEYGGGMGLWISDCLDVSAFSGISFWVRGNAPSGEAKLSALTEATTSSMRAEGLPGTCDAPEAECIQPAAMFAVTDDWTEVQIPWSAFSVEGSSITIDGSNVWQIQFDIGLAWLADENDVYAPTPGPYELVIDGMTFY